MIGVDERVAEVVVLVRELDGGLVKDDPLFHAVTLCERTCGNVADDDFERNDLHLFDDGVAVGKLLDEVGGNARLFEDLHEHIRHAVVHDALARDRALFKSVERGRVVLVVDEYDFIVVRRKYLLGFSFVKLLAYFHLLSPAAYAVNLF